MLTARRIQAPPPVTITLPWNGRDSLDFHRRGGVSIVEDRRTPSLQLGADTEKVD